MVQAFVISHLDCCNALCYGINDELTCYLQSVQNAVARLVTDTRRCDRISPVLRQLHWLPLQQRFVFKIATLVHRSLFGNARVTWVTAGPQVWNSVSQNMSSVTRPVQTVTEDIFIWTVRPRRSVNCFLRCTPMNFLFKLTNDLCRSFTKLVIILFISKAVFIKKRTSLFQYLVLKIEPP